MKLALVAIAKDEDKYLADWIEYHHKIGFDEIYIYQNNWRYKDEVPEYVHLIPFDGKIQQLNAYNDFIQTYSTCFDWALFMDIDEYLCTGKFKNAKDMFYWYHDFPAIGFNWKIFGSNEKLHYENTPVYMRFTKSQKGYNKHIKTALNFKKIYGMYGNIYDVRYTNPHFVGIAVRSYFTMSASLLRYICGPFCQLDDKIKDIPYIAHYILKSKDEFYERRSKVRADTGSLRENLDQFWKEYDLNQIDNFDIIEAVKNKDPLM